MRQLKWAVVALLLLSGGSAWGHDAEQQAELLDEVLRLSHAEVPERIILDQIGAWGFAFELTADDIVELRTLGVSDAVIRALIQTDDWEAGEGLVSTAPVYVGAGFYSPWYYYPYAWAGYCDPFPRLYAHYYYPFYYGIGFGYYGWCGSTYYAHYYPRAWHRQAWQHGNRRPPKAPYAVASGRAARRAQPITAPSVRSRNAGATSEPRVIRGSRERRASATLQRGERLRTPSASGSLRGVPANRARGSALQRDRTGTSRSAVQPRQGQASRRVQAPTWRRSGSTPSSVERALSRQRTWRTPSTASRSRSISSPSFSAPRATSPSRFQEAPRMQSGPRMQSMPRMQSAPRSVPGAISSHFGAARSR